MTHRNSSFMVVQDRLYKMLQAIEREIHFHHSGVRNYPTIPYIMSAESEDYFYVNYLDYKYSKQIIEQILLTEFIGCNIEFKAPKYFAKLLRKRLLAYYKTEEMFEEAVCLARLKS